MKRPVRLATLLAIIALIPSTSAAPVTTISAAAPVEVWADGLDDLQGVAVDGDGAAYVADRLAGTVVRMAPDRSRTVVASGLDGPIGLAFDSSGRLTVAENRGNRVTRVEPDGQRTTIISTVSAPRWLAFGPDGSLYVSARAPAPEDGSTGSDVIVRRTPSGDMAVLADQLVGLQGLAIHGGVLYAAALGPGGRSVVYAYVLAAPGSPASVLPEAGPALGLAVDARGAIFASTQARAIGDGTQGAIAKLRGDRATVRFATGLQGPTGLAFDADGHLYVADGRAGRVLKFHAPPAPLFAAVPPYTNVSPLPVQLTDEPEAEVVVEGAGAVRGTVNADGVVDLAVPVVPNATTTLEAWAIGRGGIGLTSRSTITAVVHDGVAPTIDVQSPASGVAANVTIVVRARVADGGSGVAGIAISIDGRALVTSLTPSPPAASVAATATWESGQVTPGAHTLTITASDRAGNVATISRPVLVETTTLPPEPPPSISDGSTSVPSANPDLIALTLAPVSAPILPGGTTSFGVTVTGPRSGGSARLSVDGLPAGVTASFAPPRIVAGHTAQMLVKASASAVPGATSFAVRAIQGHEPPATVSGTLTVLAGNRTALTGRVVDTDRQPLARVSIILDTLTATTDANGNFLMLDPPHGEQVVLVDGDPAGSPTDRYPTIPVSLTIVANRINELPYLPHLHRQHQRFTPIHPTRTTIATDPDLPGVALHLEPGNDIIGWDGRPADQVSIRTVPADRLPVRPLPPGHRATQVYMFYFGKRGGGVPQQPVPFEAPNDLGLAPGDKAELWYYDESPRKGEAPNDWRIAGTGTVSEDGRTIKTDPGVGIPKFCCGSAAYNSMHTGTNQRPTVTTPSGLPTSGGDPVDLSTGIFMLTATDLVIPGRRPLAITRSYRSGDTNVGPFGLGTMMGHEEFLQQTSATVLTYVYHHGGRTAFTQQADGAFVNTTVPDFRGARITVNADGTRTLRYKNGSTVTFSVPAYGIPLQIATTDPNGNRLTIVRDSIYAATSITDDGGRKLTLLRDLAQTDNVVAVGDSVGRTVRYEYDGQNRLVRVTNPAGGVTQYAYDSQHRMTVITDARGIAHLTNTYDMNYRVCRQTQADGGVYTMYYVTTDIATSPASVQLLNEAAAGGPISQAACSGTGSMKPVVATVLVDPRGHPTTYRFNGIGALPSVTDAVGWMARWGSLRPHSAATKSSTVSEAFPCGGPTCPPQCVAGEQGRCATVVSNRRVDGQDRSARDLE